MHRHGSAFVEPCGATTKAELGYSYFFPSASAIGYLAAGS